MNQELLVKSLLTVRDRDYAYARQYARTGGFELPTDGREAYAWCEKRAVKGNPEAQYVLAKFLSIGLFTPIDKHAARCWCEQAVAQECLPAFLLLAGFHEMGWGGLEPNPGLAFSLIEKAAHRDFAPALTALAVMYSTGHFVNRDQSVAFDYFRRAAELGDAAAQCALGTALLEKEDYANVAAGIKWLKEAAGQNDPSAHRRLGYFYMNSSHGLPEAPALARHHLDLAAKLENL